LVLALAYQHAEAVQVAARGVRTGHHHEALEELQRARIEAPD
jgi:hypothetical protein